PEQNLHPTGCRLLADVLRYERDLALGVAKPLVLVEDVAARLETHWQRGRWRHGQIQMRDLSEGPEVRIRRLHAPDPGHALVLREGVGHQRERGGSPRLAPHPGGRGAGVYDGVDPGLLPA